ncbi:hypothetical protein [Bacillus thuringiensis]|uniref:hypothetical protein n=1 Tax=Bacillus thuringiensis TaxID=1428 RepID=UPI003C2C4D97
MFECKSEQYRKQAVVILKTFTTSQLCSNCGHHNKDVKNPNFCEDDGYSCDTHQYTNINTGLNHELLPT